MSMWMSSTLVTVIGIAHTFVAVTIQLVHARVLSTYTNPRPSPQLTTRRQFCLFKILLPPKSDALEPHFLIAVRVFAMMSERKCAKHDKGLTKLALLSRAGY